MRPSWFLHNVLPCLILPLCSVALKPCTKDDYSTTTCSNKYSRKKSSYLQYVKAGKDCYARNIVGNHLTYNKAAARCKQEGGHLAKWESKADWDSFWKDSWITNFDFDEYYWIGGKKSGKKWVWHPIMKDITFTSWEQGQPEGRGEGCMLMRNKKWHDAPCEESRPFLCQKYGESFFEQPSNLTISVIGDHERKSFRIGDILKITCVTRTRRTGAVSIKIKTKSDGTFFAKTAGGTNLGIDEINAYYVKHDYEYFTEYERCYKVFILSLKMKVNGKVRYANISCTRRNDPVGQPVTLNIKYAPEVPVTILTGMTRNQLKPSLGEKLQYNCRGRPGDGTTMSFVISQDDEVWAMSVDKLGRTNSVGTRMSWINGLTFANNHVRDNSLGDYINLYVNFTFTYTMKKAEFACYSLDITNKVKGDETISAQDPLSQWMTLDDKTYTKIKVDDLTKAQVKGHEATDACKKFRVTCTGLGVSKTSLTFRIVNGLNWFTWNFAGAVELPPWAQLDWFDEVQDNIHGMSYRASFYVIVTRKMVTARFICKDTSYDYDSPQDSVKLNISISDIGGLEKDCFKKDDDESDKDDKSYKKDKGGKPTDKDDGHDSQGGKPTDEDDGYDGQGGKTTNEDDGYDGQGGKTTNKDDGYDGHDKGETTTNKDNGYDGQDKGETTTNKDNGYDGQDKGGNTTNKDDEYDSQDGLDYDEYEVTDDYETVEEQEEYGDSQDASDIFDPFEQIDDDDDDDDDEKDADDKIVEAEESIISGIVYVVLMLAGALALFLIIATRKQQQELVEKETERTEQKIEFAPTKEMTERAGSQSLQPMSEISSVKGSHVKAGTKSTAGTPATTISQASSRFRSYANSSVARETHVV